MREREVVVLVIATVTINIVEVGATFSLVVPPALVPCVSVPSYHDWYGYFHSLLQCHNRLSVEDVQMMLSRTDFMEDTATALNLAKSCTEE